MKYIRRLQVQYKKQVKSLGIMVWPHATDRPMTVLVARWDRYPFYNRWPAIPEFSMIHHTLCKNEILRYPFFLSKYECFILYQLDQTRMSYEERVARLESFDINHYQFVGSEQPRFFDANKVSYFSQMFSVFSLFMLFSPLDALLYWACAVWGLVCFSVLYVVFHLCCWWRTVDLVSFLKKNTENTWFKQLMDSYILKLNDSAQLQILFL